MSSSNSPRTQIPAPCAKSRNSSAYTMSSSSAAKSLTDVYSSKFFSFPFSVLLRRSIVFSTTSLISPCSASLFFTSLKPMALKYLCTLKPCLSISFLFYLPYMAVILLGFSQNHLLAGCSLKKQLAFLAVLQRYYSMYGHNIFHFLHLL